MARIKACALQAGLRIMEEFAVREGFHFPSCELFIAQGTRHLNIEGEAPDGRRFGLRIAGEGWSNTDAPVAEYRD